MSTYSLKQYVSLVWALGSLSRIAVGLITIGAHITFTVKFILLQAQLSGQPP